jgi:hypothetical protein
MAVEWGNNSLSAHTSHGWFFTRDTAQGFLPVISVRPLSPSFTNTLWAGGVENSYPHWTQLGVSTVWSQLSNDGSSTLDCIVVSNNSNNTVSYAFLESDL